MLTHTNIGGYFEQLSSFRCLAGLAQVLSRAPCMNFLSSLRQVNFQRFSHASVDHVRISVYLTQVWITCIWGFSHASVDYLRMDTILRSLLNLGQCKLAALLSWNCRAAMSWQSWGHINWLQTLFGTRKDSSGFLFHKLNVGISQRLWNTIGWVCKCFDKLERKMCVWICFLFVGTHWCACKQLWKFQLTFKMTLRTSQIEFYFYNFAIAFWLFTITCNQYIELQSRKLQAASQSVPQWAASLCVLGDLNSAYGQHRTNSKVEISDYWFFFPQPRNFPA